MNKETLKQQIAEMESKLKEMKDELNKYKKFECSYGECKTYFIDTYFIDDDDLGVDKQFIDHGRYRKTEEAAEMSLSRNKRANRLEALAEQLGGLKEFVLREDNYYIHFNSKDECCIDYFSFSYHPEKVYMTKKCAIEICRMINEGEFSLDGEL